MNEFFQDEQSVLQMLEKDDVPLPEPRDFYRKWLALESRSKLSMPALHLPFANSYRRRWQQGKPALEFPDLMLERKALQAYYKEILDIVTAFLSDKTPEVERLCALSRKASRVWEAISGWFQIRDQQPAEGAVDRGRLTDFVLQATLRPFLIAHSRPLWRALEPREWIQRVCPICGGRPDFSLLDRERGARWLLCSCCDTPWIFLRIGCPYCDNQDHESLVYFTDDSETYRLYVCRACASYVKALDLRRNGSPISVAVERILTLPLDQQAVDACAAT